MNDNQRPVRRNCSRREFLVTSAGAVVLAAMPSAGAKASAPVSVQSGPAGITQAPLPYAKNALEPHISARTVALHYDVHHKGYIDATVKRAENLKREYKTLEDVIKDTSGGINLEESLYRQAVLGWNHNCYWPSMAPTAPMLPKSGAFHTAFVDSFGTLERFNALFKDAAMKLGSGWVWLFAEGPTLSVERTDYFESPVLMAKKPLLTLDVWEHAYYLDYQNRREEYVDAWLGHLVNWAWAAKRFE